MFFRGEEISKRRGENCQRTRGDFMSNSASVGVLFSRVPTILVTLVFSVNNLIFLSGDRQIWGLFEVPAGNIAKPRSASEAQF